MFLEKSICENGVPAVEVARVISDGLMPPEATASMVNEVSDKLTEQLKPNDVDETNKIYNNLKMKANCLNEVIEYTDKTLIQVRIWAVLRKGALLKGAVPVFCSLKK